MASPDFLLSGKPASLRIPLLSSPDITSAVLVRHPGALKDPCDPSVAIESIGGTKAVYKLFAQHNILCRKPRRRRTRPRVENTDQARQLSTGQQQQQQQNPENALSASTMLSSLPASSSSHAFARSQILPPSSSSIKPPSGLLLRFHPSLERACVESDLPKRTAKGYWMRVTINRKRNTLVNAQVVAKIVGAVGFTRLSDFYYLAPKSRVRQYYPKNKVLDAKAVIDYYVEHLHTWELAQVDREEETNKDQTNQKGLNQTNKISPKYLEVGERHHNVHGQGLIIQNHIEPPLDADLDELQHTRLPAGNLRLEQPRVDIMFELKKGVLKKHRRGHQHEHELDDDDDDDDDNGGGGGGNYSDSRHWSLSNIIVSDGEDPPRRSAKPRMQEAEIQAEAETGAEAEAKAEAEAEAEVGVDDCEIKNRSVVPLGTT